MHVPGESGYNDAIVPAKGRERCVFLWILPLTTDGMRETPVRSRNTTTMQDPPQQYEVILDSIADGVFTVDGDWIITSFNRAAEEITGVPREEAIGKKCFDVFHANICQSNCASAIPCLPADDGWTARSIF